MPTKNGGQPHLNCRRPPHTCRGWRRPSTPCTSSATAKRPTRRVAEHRSPWEFWTLSNGSATRPVRRQRGISNGHRSYVNYVFPRSTAGCSAVSLCRRRYGRKYRRRGRRLPLVIDRTRRIYMEKVANILGPSADSGHPSRSSRRRRHCRPSWVVGNDGGSVFPLLLIVGANWSLFLPFCGLLWTYRSYLT